MNDREVDPELLRLFRDGGVPPSAGLAEAIASRVDRHSRRARFWTAAGVCAAVFATILAVYGLASFADEIVVTLDPEARDFRSVMTSPGVAFGALLALFAAAPWLWLRTLRWNSRNAARK